MKCAFQYGEFDMAVGPPYSDNEGHCTLEAVGEFEGEHYCLGHLTILQEEARDLQDFLKGEL
jgi:hypothetical protein